ncbi:MAG: 2-phosphosulfolactate phosphatase [Chloroflexi bacterium]|nr:2-phosphosulfolactate phosphatase [Chloroflexota bacterium]
MRIDVALLPAQGEEHRSGVCVVVDVLRASSTIVTLFARGAGRVLPAASIEEARRLKEELPDYLLCGELDGPAPEGFDYGNSPSEFAEVELSGRDAILATANGTRILNELAEAPLVLVGAFLNRSAVARAAVEAARGQGLDVTIVCSGAYSGTTFALEDALGAGAIVDAALRLLSAPEPTDAARFALYAFRARALDLSDALASAAHARGLAAIGLGDDVPYCARVDVFSVVPRLSRDEDGLLALTGAA